VFYKLPPGKHLMPRKPWGRGGRNGYTTESGTDGRREDCHTLSGTVGGNWQAQWAMAGEKERRCQWNSTADD